MSNKAIIRVCIQPYSSLLNELSFEGDFKEAVYLASPGLHEKGMQKSIRISNSLKRYWLRSSTRPTPFGLFAGCGLADASEDTLLIDSKIYHTRLDFHLLQELVSYLLKDLSVKKKCRYFSNSSIYKVLNEYRYVEYQPTSSKRKYSIRAVKASEVVTTVLEAANGGKNWGNLLAEVMAVSNCEKDEAVGFLQELVDSQILISELEPGIAEVNHLQKLINIFQSWLQHDVGTEAGLTMRTSKHQKKQLRAYLQWLREIQTYLDALNNPPAKFSKVGEQLEKHLKGRLTDLSNQQLFHVDTLLAFKPALQKAKVKGTAAELIPEELIKKVFSVLNKLAEPSSQPDLDTFIDLFTRRYEYREVPLLEALDPDIGIGYYPSTEGSLTPFLKNLKFLQAEKEVKFQPLNKAALLKQKLLQKAICQGKKEITITDELISSLEAKEDDLPPSMAVMLRKVEGNQFFLENFGGVCAVNLISRFAYANSEISNLSQEISDTEATNNPEVLFARIVHLPEEKAGNVLLHQTYRQYEIPYLSLPSVNAEYQLPLQDLYLSLQKGELVLRSLRLNRRVIPRLDTAHNYHLSELPVYRFLCDLQYQGLRTHFSFDWGHLEKYYKFLPRVSYKNVILFSACWKFDREDVATLRAAQNKREFIDAFGEFCQLWQLPKYFIYTEGDRELFINAHDQEHISLWWDVVCNKDAFLIKEYFPPDPSLVISGDGEPHAHQVVIPWINNKPTYQGICNEMKPTSGIQRCFAPGLAWLYFKIYCKPSTADILLEEVISPLLKVINNQHVVDQCFFIRYADPEEHLRIRFHLNKPAEGCYLLQCLQAALKPYIRQEIVSKTQLDTYKRELERYYGVSIKESEDIFAADSDAVLDLLPIVHGDKKESLRWQWAVFSIDRFMEDFQLRLEDKCVFIGDLQTAFAREFSLDAPLKIALDKKYRKQKEIIKNLLSTSEVNRDQQEWTAILRKRSLKIAATVAILLDRHHKAEILDLLKSYIHMSLNRIFPSAQRKQEFVIYYFLHKHYHSQLKIQQYQEMKKPAMIIV